MSDSDDVTPGQVAFVAFHERAKTMADPLAGWSHAPADQRMAWETAASAAITFTLRRVLAWEEALSR
jgi:hypothetical protein